MVQARQIFSMRAGILLKVANEDLLKSLMENGTSLLLQRFSLPSGAFRHSIDESAKPLDDTPDLYGQAFVLFALAEAFAVSPQKRLRDRGKELLVYLRKERAAPGGGFTEISHGEMVYRSNPHMHLFEAALAWVEVDSDPEWRQLAKELLDLCLGKFFDPKLGLLAERFHEGWDIERENGRYIFEPGHLCEWSWLLGRYQKLLGEDLITLRKQLFSSSEAKGLDAKRGALMDEIWSDGEVKTSSSRFWPQCERIKAASQLGFRDAAEAGMEALFRYFDTPIKGLWHDTWDAFGSFRVQPVKASSLYHIIGAILEFHRMPR